MKLRTFLQSLHLRLITLILLASLPMAALIVGFYLQEREQNYAAVQQNALGLAGAVAVEYERLLDNGAQFVSSLAARPEFWLPAPVGLVDTATCEDLFTDLIAENDGYSGIAATDPDGAILCSYPPSPTPHLAEVAVVEEAVQTGDVVVSDFDVGSLSGRRIVIVAAPVGVPGQELAAVLALGIDLERVGEVIEMAAPAPETSLIILDRNGDILVRQPGPEDYTGESIDDLLSGPDLPGGEAMGVFQSSGPDGVERLFAYVSVREPVPDSGRVLVGIPIDEAYGQVDQNLRRQLIFLAAITGLILLAARIIAMRWILGPVARLNRAIKQLQSGDLSARTGVEFRGDEISMLTRAFDELAASLEKSSERLASAYDRTLEGWSRALDLRDHETEGHSQRVTRLTVKLARAMGVAEPEIAHIRRGALLHDIGKIGIPDRILSKPGPLDDKEWQIMRRHPTIAYNLLREIDFLAPSLEIPRWHHEKWDGSGYPDGLQGEEIPLAARLFAVADVWDALRSDRPYREAWDDGKALAYIREQSGAHFDPEVVRLFLSITGSNHRST